MLCAPKQSKACVDPDSTIQVRMSIDTVLEEFELRLTNLRLHNEAPNVWCSCAAFSFGSLFDSIHYITFVDSGTNTVYSNFEPWYSDDQSNQMWNDFLGSSNTSGFIGVVSGSGLAFNVPVELVIRGLLTSSPPSSFYVDSILATGTVYTDMIDQVAMEVAGDHLGTRHLYDGAPGVTARVIEFDVPGAYFDELDAEIRGQLTSIQEAQPALLTNLSPVPATDFSILRWNSFEGATIELHNSMGALQRSWFAAGDQTRIERNNLPGGHYFIRVIDAEGAAGTAHLLFH